VKEKQMIKNRFLAIFLTMAVVLSAFLATSFAVTTPVQAQDITSYEILRGIPVLPHCPNPGGEVIVSYDSGIHQIPGNGLLEGSDKVYRVGDNLFVQCYCPQEESDIDTGIEAQWIHESYLTPEQEQFLLNLGWLRIEDGTQWGLPAGVYFVNNNFFKCNCGQACKPCVNNCETIAQKREIIQEQVVQNVEIRREEASQMIAAKRAEIESRMASRLSRQR
jgi:hypothetical protein